MLIQMTGVPMAQQRVWIELIETDLANETVSWLKHNGVTEVNQSNYHSLDPMVFPMIITGVIAGAGIVTSLISWLRRQRRCLLIIDARESIKMIFDCTEREGRTIVIARDGTRVEVVEPGELLDFGDVVKAAITQGAESAVRIAESAGASARVMDRES